MGTLRETMIKRFKTEWVNKPNTRPLFSVLSEALDLAEDAENRAKVLEKSGRYSERGLREAIRGDFAKNTLPEVSKLTERLSGYKDATANKRAKMALPKVDPEDPYAAMLRQEARAIMRSMQIGEVMGVLTSADNKVAMEAAFEVPGWMVNSRFDANTRNLVERSYIEKHHPEILAQVEDQEEAIALAESALTHGVNTVRRLAGFDGSDTLFYRWLANPSATQERDAA